MPFDLECPAPPVLGDSSVASYRFVPVTLADLTSWPEDLTRLDASRTAAAREAYELRRIRRGVTPAEARVEWDASVPSFRAAQALRLARVHAALAFQCRCLLLPRYAASRTKSASPPTRPCPPSEVAGRERAWRRLEDWRLADAEDLEETTLSSDVEGPPETFLSHCGWQLDPVDQRRTDFTGADPADASSAGAASSYLRAAWFASVVLGRIPHPHSAVRPLRPDDRALLLRLGAPEELVSGGPLISPDPPADFGPRPSLDQRYVRDSSLPFLRDLPVARGYMAYRAARVARDRKGVDPLAADAAVTEGSRHAFYSQCGAAFDLAERPPSSFASVPRPSDAWTRAFKDAYAPLVSRLRREVLVGAALDPAGADRKRAKGRLPEEDAATGEMLRALTSRVWTEGAWGKLLAPRLRSRGLADTPEAFAGGDDDGLADYLRAAGLGPAQREALQVLLGLLLSFLRAQVWADSLASEYRRDGTRYVLASSRAFKTSSSLARESLPSMSRWRLGPVESGIVRVLLALRPASAAPAFFVDEAGTAVSRAKITSAFARVGRSWLGIPRFGPHVMRSWWASRAIEEGIRPEALASLMQSSRSTVLMSYAASASGPGQEAMDALRISAATAPLPPRPNGKALRRARDAHVRVIEAFARERKGTEVKVIFDLLKAWRAAGVLVEKGAEWFAYGETFWGDEDFVGFRKYLTSIGA